ncbi:proline--tRNA ligase [Thermodesulfobacterium sp. TA1]|uniref:proline--tRNA ligase n=1 Tax=Thermodesulfobacterium sp. TA1 TaxID=2234087 RepID=UPI00123205FB|nr:proline--tRNA ligase [Thermodesulfobacterium sp. TA1]QER42588.1 proline--tRNA ligase [Thermodesulfobacterium sp. TA1]
MRLSRYFLPTLREDPSEAETVSHKLLLRAGMIRKVASGIYNFLPLGFKALKKIENIVRTEMDRAGALEILMPLVQPAELWQETGRWDLYGKELLRIKDRKDHDFCLGPTHEEVVTDIVRRDVKSYKDLPLILYQIAVKFRDEIRPRFGIMRAREFIMKDAYSFDANEEGLEKSYQKMYDTYHRIFESCGLRFKAVEAHTGAIGGDVSHEFMVLAETGEDTIAFCEACGYASNIELTPAETSETYPYESSKPLEKVYTPGVRSAKEVADFLGLPVAKITKTLIYIVEEKEAVAVCIRGDHEVNEVKLEKLLGGKPFRMARDEEIRKIAGANPGFIGPKGLRIKVIADKSLVGYPNFVIGANEDEYHYINANLGDTFQPDIIADIRKATEGDLCPRCKKTLNFLKGIEVGHIFKLGTKYSLPMKAMFLDRDGQMKPFIMGCYGIGVSRVLAATIEQNHDEKGIIFPWQIAPFQIGIISLKESFKENAEKLYQVLSQKWDVLLDDRDERPGVKFNDLDLIGVPLQLILGKTFEERGEVEVKQRKTGERVYLKPEGIESYVQDLLKKGA